MEFQDIGVEPNSTIVTADPSGSSKDRETDRDNFFEEALWNQCDDDLQVWQIWR